MQIGNEDLLAQGKGVLDDGVGLDLCGRHRQKDTNALCTDEGLETQQIGVYDVA